MRWLLESVLVVLLPVVLLGGWLLMRRTARRVKAQQQAAEAATERGLEALAQVTLALSQQLDPDRLLQQITDALATLTGAHNVVLWEVDREAGLLVRRAWTADPSIGAMELPSSLTMAQGGTGWIARHREPLFVEDIAADARIMAAQWALSRDLVAFGGVPVAAGEELLGVLTLNLKRGGLPQGGDRRLLPSFAAQAAVAMRNARLFADNTRLYEEARQRLRELQDTQGQLLQAGRLSAVGQLVSGVAHELNNPLSVVIGYGQLLLSRGVPEDARRPLGAIVAQGARMAKIIQSLLLFSRQRKPERRPVDVADVIPQILNLRETQLALSGIRVETEFGADVPCAEGDAHQLQQVVLNLILNAEQAILGRGVGGRRTGDHIRITTSTRQMGDTTRVVVQVSDNGPGIAPAVLPRVFEPFFTTKQVGDGAGLGLSVSYGIVEQHGGRLSVESEPGRTVFTLELPVATSRDPEPDAATEPDRRCSGRAAAPARGRRALVVDDEAAIVELVTAVLDDQGWRVDAAPGGRAALERLQQVRYDLILSDVCMPEGNGADFYRAAVAQQNDLARRFLFMTGDTANEDAWRVLQSTRVPVLSKPFTPQALLHAVAQVSA
ncbi:MAG TPA: ATP-binding protein [Candidatus Limnocylindria bacterium]|nr:ATP-binding protein [Candidatus Limnocylindria bacterium]